MAHLHADIASFLKGVASQFVQDCFALLAAVHFQSWREKQPYIQYQLTDGGKNNKTFSIKSQLEGQTRTHTVLSHSIPKTAQAGRSVYI